MALTRKTVAENSADTAPRVAGDVVTVDELTSRLGYANSGMIRARLERDGAEIVQNWLGRPAVSAQAAYDLYTRMKAEAEELAEQNRAYNAYIEERRLAVIEKQREEARKERAKFEAQRAQYKDAHFAAKAEEAQREREAQIAQSGAPVSFADFTTKGKR